MRHKPGWDVTRLRQAAYIGDWVWYGARAVQRLGGFDPARAGAEEFDLQLRLAEAGAKVERVPEALFTRSPQSRRDDIRADVFCARAAEAVQAHLQRAGLPAEVQNRQHLGLFHHMRMVADPGTSIIMLCDGARDPGAGPLAHHAAHRPAAYRPGDSGRRGAEQRRCIIYLTAVTQQTEALEGKVLAVPPVPGLTRPRRCARPWRW